MESSCLCLRKNAPFLLDQLFDNTNIRIWTVIMHNNTLSRNVHAFLWKCIHEAHKCGPYWDCIPGYENQAICTLCDETKSMDHILFRCT